MIELVKKVAHPEELFDYLRGELGRQARELVDQHLSNCPECRAVAELIQNVKDAAQSSTPAPEHPDVSKLASLFYGGAKSARASMAAHVATCSSCAGELAEYARAERAAAEYTPSQAVRSAVPTAAWEMIRDWEESSFAVPKPANYAISRDMIAKLNLLLAEQREQLEARQPRELTHPVTEPERAALVPVIVVDRSGRLRGVEMFEKATDARGADVLRYTGESERFDEKPFHALLDFGDQNRVVVTDLILRDKIRLPRVDRADAELRGADYFIIED